MVRSATSGDYPAATTRTSGSARAEAGGGRRGDGEGRTRSQRSRQLRLALIVPLLALAWALVTRVWDSALSISDPSVALALNSRNPAALLTLAERTYNEAASEARKLRQASEGPAVSAAADGSAAPRTGKIEEADRISYDEVKQQLADARALAERAVAQDGVNGRGLQVLGAIAELQGDNDTAYRAMKIAIARSKHESFAVFWMMMHAYKRGDLDAAVEFADLLMRTNHLARREGTQMLALVAETPGGLARVKDVLLKKPNWRSAFFEVLPNFVTQAAMPVSLFAALQDSDLPPTPRDYKPYFDLLMRLDRHDVGRYVWLQTLSAEQLGTMGLLYNGSFRYKPSGAPYDWVIEPSEGATTEIISNPDNSRKSVLAVQFQRGRVQFGGVTQMVQLAPGAYVLKGFYKGQLSATRRGFTWSVDCGRREIGTTPLLAGVERDWQAFEAAFTVPQLDCPAQMVRLQFRARTSSEQLVSGEFWFSDLVLQRVQEE